MEDAALMIIIQLSLVLVYTCVLLIKTCDVSPEACAMYGLGTTSEGESSCCCDVCRPRFLSVSHGCALSWQASTSSSSSLD